MGRDASWVGPDHGPSRVNLRFKLGFFKFRRGLCLDFKTALNSLQVDGPVKEKGTLTNTIIDLKKFNL